MNEQTQAASGTELAGMSEKLRTANWERAGALYARTALGAAFLSAVASRFGLWDKTIDLKHFANFMQYTAEVNSFLPAALIPFLAWAATLAETSCGILLILGLWPRWVSLASALLLAAFGTAMAISFGPKSPLDYSVFSASGAAVLLALHAFRQSRSLGFQSQRERTIIMKLKRSSVLIIAALFVTTLSSAQSSAQKQNDEQLLRARETVWRAWFAGDTKTLEQLVPPARKNGRTRPTCLPRPLNFMPRAENSSGLNSPAPKSNTLAMSLSFGVAMSSNLRLTANVRRL
jgi:uncharacterized membrane protein YphA (DoxX/SURF4 family)